MELVKTKTAKKVCAIILILSVIAWLLPVNAEKAEAATHNISSPKVSGTTVRWDCVYFGSYPQSSATGATKDPIKWRVLSVNGNDAFLISDTKLDLVQYYTSNKSVSFANSYIRTWLNSTFLNSAFNTAEQAAMINMSTGKVAVMTPTEAQNSSYGFVSNGARAALNTNYTIKKFLNNGVSSSYANMTNGKYYGAYWLNDTSNSSGNIRVVRGAGDIDSIFTVTNKIICVRPVIHLDLSSSTWSYADKLMTNGQTAPNVPSGITAQNISSTQAKVSWNKVFEADGYQIYKYEGSSYVSSKTIASANTVSWSDTDLTPGNTYKYKVRAYWTVGSTKKYSSFTSLASVTLPKASQTITAKYSSSVTKYCSSSTFNLGASAKTALTYTSSNTSVATVDAKGNVKVKKPGTAKITITAGSNANYLSKTKTITINAKLNTPAATAKTGSKKGQININWKTVYGADGYIVYKYDSKKGYVQKWRVKKTSTVNKYLTQTRKYNSKTKKYYWTNTKTTTGLPILMDTGLTKGKRYYYKVKAYSGSKYSLLKKVSAIAKK